MNKPECGSHFSPLTSHFGPRPVICLFGSYEPKPGEPAYELAYQIGHGLAAAGFDVCNGGYDGIMKASAKGAKDAGGSTVGVTCSIFTGYCGQPLKANRYIDREILTQDPFTRIRTMMELAHGYVVLPGGTGTLSEFAIVWESVAKKLTPPRPIFIVGDFWQPTVDTVAAHRPKHASLINRVETAGELVDLARRTIRVPAG